MKIVYGYCKPSLPAPIALTPNLEHLLSQLFERASADYKAKSGNDLSTDEIKMILSWDNLEKNAKQVLKYKDYWHFMPINKDFSPYLIYRTIIYSEEDVLIYNKQRES